MGELPQIPTNEVGLGLASALLLFLATYLVARSHSDRAPRSRSSFSGTPAVEPIFSMVPPDSTSRGLSFLGSLFIHLVVVAVVPSIQILSYDIPPIAVPQYEIITLDYRMPLPPVVPTEDVQLDAATTPPEPSSEADAEETTEQAAALGAPEGALTAPPRLTAPSPPGSGSAGSTAQQTKTSSAERTTVRILLPDKLQTDPSKRDIVIQPKFTEELPSDFQVNLPPVILWAEAPPKLQTGAVLEPVRRRADALLRAALPDVLPQIRPPNEQPALADLQIPAAPVINEFPALPLPPADVIPLSGQSMFSDLAAPPSIFGDQGQNSLIALTQQPDLQTTQFELRPGLRVGSIDTKDASEGADNGNAARPGPKPLEPSSAMTAGDGAGSSGTGEGPGEGEAATDAGGTGSSDLIASVHTAGEGGAKVIELKGSGEGGSGSIGTRQSGLGLGDEGAGPGKGGRPDGEAGGKGELKPLPRSQYGIILVSNNHSEIPEANGVLSGTPVYTVYIDVPQFPRKWVLQYCVPQSSRTDDAAPGVIRIKRVERVDPPHVLTAQPVQLELPADHPPRIVVYAQFDEQGNIANSRVIRGADAKTDEMILASLQSWDFYPAFQHGEPVSVEAVFGIPLY